MVGDLGNEFSVVGDDDDDGTGVSEFTHYSGNRDQVLVANTELPPVSWTSKLKSREWEAFRVELRPESWTRLMVAVMRLPVGPDPGILPGSGP